ncbi:non-ribosomal peptide synthetase, partial [Pseudomonas congelans]|uniref:non-ribosomal peptide synthetase n=2 Tax=Pseudomonas congelans TaxID=200452 RepID=UPI000BDCA194
IYTSGSTGNPKGVMIEHRGLVNYSVDAARLFGLSQSDTVLQQNTLNFDLSVEEIFPALLAGATLAPSREIFGSEGTENHGIYPTVLHLTAAHWHTLVAEWHNQPQAAEQRLAEVRLINVTGDALSAQKLKLWDEVRPAHTRLINTYGPTEATVSCTAAYVSHDALAGSEGSGNATIGKPMANTRIYLLDEHQQPVPYGVAGEIFIGGDGVARGYLNLAEVNAERFLTDPFSNSPDARMYKTGDLARYMADGRIEYLGRNDFQVKVRGFRIELGEIEARLGSCKGVKEAVVIAREDNPGEKRLVAYVIAQPQASLDVARLRAELAPQLAEYMLPSAFVLLDALPLTPNRKLDRKALPAPADNAFASREHVAPQGTSEKALAQIWQNLLNLEAVGRHDHFFELGGHSLLAMRLISQVRQRMGVELSLADIFAQPELAALAQVVAHAAGSSQQPIVPVSRDQSLPLSFAQQRLWFLAQLDGGSAAYHIPAGLRLRGSLDQDALKRALDRIVARHEALRTTFVQEQDQDPLQRIAPADIGFSLQLQVLTGQADAEQQLLAIAAEEAEQGFDLLNGPLVRGRLVCLADDDHVLLVTMHHIVSDGWSAGVLTRELGLLYAAFSEGAEDPLPALPVQYADYALWQRNWLSGDVLQQQRQYWQQTLAGAPALLTLPSDRPRPAQQDYSGQLLGLVLDADLTRGLKALSQRHGSSLFMTVMAAWAALLGRLAGQDDVVIGTPVANRLRAEVEDLIGFFVNTLAVRVDLSGRPSVQSLLQQVKQQTLAAQANQDLPFEQVVEVVRPQRSLSHSPIFQAMLSWQNNEASDLALGDMTLQGVAVAGHTAKFDLTLDMTEVGDQLIGTLEYATALFDESTLQRYMGYFQRLLEAMVADDRQLLEQVPLLDAVERQHLLVELNATDMPYPQDCTIHQLFEEKVQTQPDAIAVVFEAQRLSYAELNRQANRLAHHLIGLGIGPDYRVAICVERGVEMMIGLLGVLKAGAAYVPLDPAYPAERLAYMINDSQPTALLTQRDLQKRLPTLALPLVLLDDDQRNTFTERDDNPVVEALGVRNLAYVIYTSGSTGNPKGVMIEHRGLVNYSVDAARLFALSQSDTVLQQNTLNFDLSVEEIFPALLAGATLAPSREIFGSEGTETHGIKPSVLHLTAAHWHTLVAEWHNQPQAAMQRLAEVRLINVTGDALSAQKLKLWDEVRPAHTRLINTYGPTEATVSCTAAYVSHDAVTGSEGSGNATIGKPMANTRIYLLDAHQQPVPYGVAGEIFIGGDGVARGYLNLAEVNAERFLADPFSNDPDARMYKTGDLARYMADGRIEYLGRNDFQVKVRGFRIELGEIEARLGNCAGVKEAVVIAREDNPGDKRLVAYVVAQPQSQLTAAELRAELAPQLAEYMLPSAFVLLDELPLTPNRKLDRKALPAPDADALISRGYEAPQGETEEQIVAIWQDLLDVEQVGRHDHFFELGGHSLLAVSLIERLRKQDLNLNVKTVFTAPTVREMALAISQDKQALFQAPANRIPANCTQLTPDMLPLVELSAAHIELITSAVPGGAANIQDIYPLAPLQEGILFHYLLNRERDAYLMRSMIEFDSRARLDAFLEGLQTVIDRHDVLRSSVHWNGLPQAVQVVHRQAQFSVHTLTLTPDEDALSQVDRLTDPSHLRLDLRQAPLLLAYVAGDPNSERWLLALLDHHMVSDHVTLELILEEVRLLMRGQGADLLPPQPYREFVAQTLAIPASAHEAYFTRRLADVDSPTVPFDLVEVKGDGNDVEEAELALSSDLCAGIRTQARERGMSPAVLFHVAWAQVLARCTGRDDVVFGTVVTGRLQGTVGAERAMGMFMNTLPVRVQLATQGAQELVMATHRDLSELLSHEQASLALAQRCSGMATAVPLFSSLLNYRHQSEDSQLQWPGLRLLDSSERTNYPLCLSVNDYGSDLGLLIHSVQPADPQRLCAMMQCALEQLTDALAHTPQMAVTQLDVLPAAERNLLLETFNQNHQDYPKDLCIQHLFEAQVRTQPDAIAVAFQAQRLSYAELNRQANRLAHHLIGLGIGPDDRVAICVERGVEMMVGLLGVLKAGAAYVPLDPAYPAERLAYMIEDSTPSALLTQRDLQMRLPTLTLPLVLLDEDQRTTFTERDDDPVVEALGVRNLAYVIYTSGSTGNPKGVMIEHRGLVNYSVDAVRLFALSQSDTVLQQNTLNFDLSVEEIFPALLAGATLAPSREVFGSEGTETHGIHPTVLHLTAAHWHTLVAEWHKQPQLAAQRLQHVRLINVTGDALSAQKLKLWDEVRPAHTRLINTYGPTEATVSCTAAYVSHDAVAGSEG